MIFICFLVFLDFLSCFIILINSTKIIYVYYFKKSLFHIEYLIKICYNILVMGMK